MLLMNICTIHRVNNKFVDELLSLLHKYFLPLDNCLLTNMYHAKTLSKKVSLNYKMIHACPNGCVLFKGVYIKLRTCPKCGSTQYKDVGWKKVPTKVLHHFPFIMHFKCMLWAPIMSNLMVWHSDNKTNDGLFWHVAYIKAWMHIDALWPKFATKPHNVKLRFDVDRINPFGGKNNNWSIWPILFFNYNFPPWLVTNFFVMLNLHIPSRESMKMHNFDVYMTPMIKEFQMLWRGLQHMM